MQSQSWLTEWNLATFSTHLFLPGRLRFPCTQTHTRTHSHAADPTQHYIIPPLVHWQVAPLPINAAAAAQWSRCAFLPYRTRCFWWSDLPWRDARCVLHLPLATSQRGEAWRSATARSRTADYILRLKQAARGGRRGRSKALKNACQRAGSVSAPTAAAASASHCIQLRLLRPGRSLLPHAGIVIEGGVGGGASGAVAAKQGGKTQRISRRYYFRRPSTWVTAPCFSFFLSLPTTTSYSSSLSSLLSAGACMNKTDNRSGIFLHPLTPVASFECCPIPCLQFHTTSCCLLFPYLHKLG